MAGGSRPISSYILQEFIRFADSWATKVSLFLAMTGSFTHILMGLDPIGLSNLAWFNIVMFSLSIWSSLYGFKDDPGINTFLILYVSIFLFSYAPGLLSLVVSPATTTGPDAPLESMAERVGDNGFAVDRNKIDGSSIPSYAVTREGTTYHLYCLHNERYDASYFEESVKGRVIEEVRDNGYHCKITSDSTTVAPSSLKAAITGNVAGLRTDERTQDEPLEPSDNTGTNITTEDQDLRNAENHTRANQGSDQRTESEKSTVTSDDTSRVKELKERIEQREYTISLDPNAPEVSEHVEATFENAFSGFDGSLTWYRDGYREATGYPGQLQFASTGVHDVAVKIDVENTSTQLLLDEKTVVVSPAEDESEDQTPSSEENQKNDDEVVEPLPSKPRIAFWCGKVNQHREEGEWRTDPDGVSGCGEDKLSYCQRFYPDTVSVEEAGEERITGWRARGNRGSHTATRMTYRCVQPS